MNIKLVYTKDIIYNIYVIYRLISVCCRCSTPNSGFSDLHDKPKSFESIFAQHNAIDSQNSATSKEHYSLQNVYVRAVTDFIATDDSHLGITKGSAGLNYVVAVYSVLIHLFYPICWLYKQFIFNCP